MKTGATTMTADAQSSAELTVRVSRLIKAPRQRVFDSWVKPELRRKWWLTQSGDQLRSCQIDARVGGRYRQSQMGGCDDSDQDETYEWIMEGEFLEVVERWGRGGKGKGKKKEEKEREERGKREGEEGEGGKEGRRKKRGRGKKRVI